MTVKKLTYPFGKIELCKNYMVAILNEGVLVKEDITHALIAISEDYFKNNPFVYISLRKHAYTIDPKMYLTVSRIENLIGLAVVMSNPTVIDNTEVEKLFLNNIPFMVFENLDQAKLWAKKTITMQSNHF